MAAKKKRPGVPVSGGAERGEAGRNEGSARAAEAAVERLLAEVAASPDTRELALPVPAPREATPFWKRGWVPEDDREELAASGEWDGTALRSRKPLAGSDGLVAVWAHAPSLIDPEADEPPPADVGEETLSVVDEDGLERPLGRVPREALRAILAELLGASTAAAAAPLASEVPDAALLGRRLRALASEAARDDALRRALAGAVQKLSPAGRAGATQLINAREGGPMVMLDADVLREIKARIDEALGAGDGAARAAAKALMAGRDDDE